MSAMNVRIAAMFLITDNDLIRKGKCAERRIRKAVDLVNDRTAAEVR